MLQLQQKSDEIETTTTSAQSSETPPPVTAAVTSSTVTPHHYQEQHHPQQQQQQQHRQRAALRDERRQWLILQDRKSRSLEYPVDDLPQQPAPTSQHLVADQHLHPTQPSGVQDETPDEYRSRRRRLQETQRKSRSLDVYEPSPSSDGAAPSRASVARLRRSTARVIEELPEQMTYGVPRGADTSSVCQEQWYTPVFFLGSFLSI